MKRTLALFAVAAIALLAYALPADAQTSATLTNGTATLNWSPISLDSNGNAIPTSSGGVSNAITAYNVYQGASATSLVKVGSVAASATSYTATGLATGTYFFAITAVNAVGEGGKSNVVSGTVPPALAVPAAPTGLTVK